MPSAVGQLCGIARSQGFKRLITYVRRDNRASLRAFEKLGFRKFGEDPELKLLFLTRRKHIQVEGFTYRGFAEDRE